MVLGGDHAIIMAHLVVVETVRVGPGAVLEERPGAVAHLADPVALDALVDVGEYLLKRFLVELDGGVGKFTAVRGHPVSVLHGLRGDHAADLLGDVLVAVGHGGYEVIAHLLVFPAENDLLAVAGVAALEVLGSLVHEQNIRAGVGGLDGCGCTCAAKAHNQHVADDVPVNFVDGRGLLGPGSRCGRCDGGRAGKCRHSRTHCKLTARHPHVLLHACISPQVGFPPA